MAHVARTDSQLLLAGDFEKRSWQAALLRHFTAEKTRGFHMKDRDLERFFEDRLEEASSRLHKANDHPLEGSATQERG